MPELGDPDPEADISDDPRSEDTWGETPDAGAPGRPGGESDEAPGSDDAYFRSLFLPVDELPAADTSDGEEGGGGEAPPWAAEATSVVEPPQQPEDPRRAHFVGTPKASRRRPVPAPVIRGMVGVAAVLALLVVVLLVTGGDSPDAVSAEDFRRAPTRAIPTLPLGTVAAVLPTNETAEEVAPETAPPATGAKRTSTGGSTGPVVFDPGLVDPGTGTTIDTTPGTTVDTTPVTTAPPPPPTTVVTTPPTTVDTTPTTSVP